MIKIIRVDDQGKEVQLNKENTPAHLKKLRRGEFLAALPLAYLAWRGWNKQDQWNELAMDHTKNPQGLSGDLVLTRNLFESFSKYHIASHNLYRAYDRAYHKSLTTMVPTPNGNGGVTLRPQTTYYWDEESGVPKHQVISSWRSAASNLTHKVKGVTEKPLLDLAKLNQIGLEVKSGNETSKKALSALVCGTATGAMLFYEELFAYFNKNYQGYQKSLEKISKPNQVKRRDMIKVIGGTLAAAVATGLALDREDKLEEKGEKLARTLEEVQNRDIGFDGAFQDYFNRSLNVLQEEIKTRRELVANSLSGGIKSAEVREAFVELSRVSIMLEEAIDDLQANEWEATELNVLCRSAQVTEELEAASDVGARGVVIGNVLETLGLYGVMAAIIIPGEIWNKKRSEQESRDKLS